MSGKKQSAGAVRLAAGAASPVAKIESPAPAPRPPLATDREADRPEGPFQWGMIYLLARIFYAMRGHTEDALKPYGLTPMQVTILATLNRWDGLSSAEMSRRFGVTPQTMGEMIANLERRSLLARTQDPSNRRALKLNLTADGRKMVRQCDEVLDGVETDMFKGMSEREFKQLRRQLAQLHDDLGLTED